MTVKIIAENIIETDDFSSATEQEGEFIGQPTADSDNTGDFRLLASGDIEDFTYEGTTTGAGAGGGTTTIDSALNIFGDDYFIDGKLKILSGDCENEEQDITDFAQSTGTLTHAAFSAQIAAAVDYRLTVKFSTRDFRVELITGGDAGTADFKWSHDGGTTYLGRDDPDQATWLAEHSINDVVTNAIQARGQVLLEMPNGDLLAAFNDSANSDLRCVISSDNGLSWGSEIQISTADEIPYCGLVLGSGRVLIYAASGVLVYSDDSGVTWTETTCDNPYTYICGVCLLLNGNILGDWTTNGTNHFMYQSSDGGFTWSSCSWSYSVGSAFYASDFVQISNGNILYAAPDWDAGDGATDLHVVRVTSNFTSIDSTDIIDSGDGNNRDQPSMMIDLDGRVFIAYRVDDAASHIAYTWSDDGGGSWDAEATLYSSAANLGGPCLLLYQGYQTLCSYMDESNGDLDMRRRGIWEAYSANACVVAIDLIEQKLINDVGIIWKGGAGVAGDIWQFEADYDYSMKNLISDSPSKPWRSEQDGINIDIEIDMTANNRFLTDAAALFNTNIQRAMFQLGDGTTDLDDTDIIGHWKLDDEEGDKALDSSGEDNHMTLNGGPTWVDGIASGGALDFEATDADQYGVTAEDIALSGDMTLCAWLRAESLTDATYMGLITCEHYGAGADLRGWGITIQDTTISVHYAIDATTGGLASTSYDFIVGKLYHVAVTWDDDQNTFEYFINGSSVDTDTVTDVRFNGNHSVAIGRLMYDNDAYYFDGIIDEPWAFQRILTDAEIQDLYDHRRGFEYNVDEEMDFSIASGTIDAVNADYIRDTSLMANYQDHELAGKLFQATSGTDGGVMWRIKDNTGVWIIIDTTAAHNLAADDTFEIYNDRLAIEFTSATPRRYVRLAIDSHQTPDDYYQIGTMISGMSISLDKAWIRGYQRTNRYDLNLLRTPQGGIISIDGADRKRIFNLSFPPSDTSRKQILSLFDFLKGKNICLIPDADDLTDIYLVKLVSDINQFQSYDDLFRFSLEFEEVL